LDWLLFLIEMVGAFPGKREQKNEEDEVSSHLHIEAENRKTP
jgi:hypothetical protein